MYIIKRKGKLPNMLNTSFTSYNEAYALLRKWLRNQLPKGCRQDAPPMSMFGFTIVKV